MLNIGNKIDQFIEKIIDRFSFGLRTKLIVIFMLVKVIPLILMAVVAWWQITIQGRDLKTIAVDDSTAALNSMAVENIERMSTDTATEVADFLYARDADLLYVAKLAPTEESYKLFIDNSRRKVVIPGPWALDEEENLWVPSSPPPQPEIIWSSNSENTDKNGFQYRPPDYFKYKKIPLYDEVTFLDLQGNEIIKAHPLDSPKVRYPMSRDKKDVSKKENTYIKSEDYFKKLTKLNPGEIYVSDVMGAYVRSNHIGMYSPTQVAQAALDKGYEIEYLPEEQAYAGVENPYGRRFEGIVRWATPVADKEGRKIGYVTLALNHDHIMEFVDHMTPMNERTTELPNAYNGNYAFIWDYKCRSVVHPRHHSITGFNPETGEPEVPWLEATVYEGWKTSGLEKWTDYTKNYQPFKQQTRTKKPSMDLTKAGFVGLDGRWLNTAPQCTGWMDLTSAGGSGSFYILWSGLYKINTAAAIPYYTGQYAPTEANNFSRRGFGFVAIGSELEYFTAPAQGTEQKLVTAISKNLQSTFIQLLLSTFILTVLVIFIAIWMASFITNRITGLIEGITHFRSGERQFRFNSTMQDEFGVLADSLDDMSDSIVDSVKAPLAIIGMNHNIIYMNSHSLKLVKSPLDDIVGKPYFDYSIYPYNSQYCPITALHEGREAQIIHLEHDNFFFKGVANYLLNKDNEQIGYIIETVDLTEMVLRQIELKKTMDEATRANTHKSEFLARMSHEIRTPMNAIIGLTNVVCKLIEEMDAKDEDLNEVQTHMRHVETASHHLLGLLNDVLDVSKIEAGKITFTKEPVELPQLIDTIQGIIKPRCDTKNIPFKILYNDFTPSTFITDSLRLRQVIINLLGNAVKFTPELGVISFHVVRKERKDGLSLVQFEVHDTGIGISEQAIASIFKPFEQASEHITSQYGGTGLGLTISRHIIKLMGGDIDIQSKVGEGSIFSFAIWLKETDSKTCKPENLVAPDNKLLGKKILLVDDVDLNRKVAKAMMKVTGVTIDEADDGTVAVEKFRESPINTYDLIIMDIQMPQMNGYQAAEAIRAMDRADASTVPIIALTANAFTDDIEKAKAAGMNAHIAKPVKANILVGMLFSHILKED